MVHYLGHNAIFYIVLCIYMLLTKHEINNMLNLWLNLDCQLEYQDIYLKNVIYVPKNIIMDFWIKKMDWFYICAFMYMHLLWLGIWYIIEKGT